MKSLITINLFLISIFSYSQESKEEIISTTIKYHSNLSRPFTFRNIKSIDDSVILTKDSLIIYNDIFKTIEKIELKKIKQLKKAYLEKVWPIGSLMLLLSLSELNMAYGPHIRNFPALNYITGGILLVSTYFNIRSNRILIIETDSGRTILYSGMMTRKLFRLLKSKAHS